MVSQIYEKYEECFLKERTWKRFLKFNDMKFYSRLLEVINFKIHSETENKQYYRTLELVNILRNS